MRKIAELAEDDPGSLVTILMRQRTDTCRDAYVPGILHVA
jgi:hypothetical protein